MMELRLEFRREGRFRTVVSRAETMTCANFEALRRLHEKDGWDLHSWAVTERLPYDEGREAALAGAPKEANPYADSYWKHDEWWLGWDAAQESAAG